MTARMLAILPTRGRRELTARCIKTFAKTTDSADLLVVIDEDDTATYKGLRYPARTRKQVIPRTHLSAKINQVAVREAQDYDAVIIVGDDHTFDSPGWDTAMMATLDAMGGTGIVWPEDKRRSDLGEIPMISSDIIKALGWFSYPGVRHFWADNVLADIGRAVGRYERCPGAVITHHHWSADPSTPHDATYTDAEKYGADDGLAYQAWQRERMAADVATVRELTAKADRPAGLLVMVPTRGRPEQCERLLESFRKHTANADIAFILDPDDDPEYDAIDWGDALRAVLKPRGTLSEKLNQTAMQMASVYPALMWAGDDHEFSTPGWDTLMLAALDDMGGHGWVYPATKRRSDVPEIWLASSSVVQHLGWFFPPCLSHYAGDNSIAELAKRAGMLRFCPDAAVEHKHWTTDPDVARDATYREAEAAYGAADLAAFQEWRDTVLPHEVSRLRRQYSKDIEWAISRIA